MVAGHPVALRIRASSALVLLLACAVTSPLLAQPRSVANLAVTNTTGNLYEEGARPGARVYPPTRELFFAEAPDLALGGPMPLVFQRYYAQYLSSDGFATSRIGTNWLGTYDWKLTVAGMNATLVTNRGRVVEFTSPMPGTWVLVSPLDIPYQLVQAPAEFTLLDPSVRRIYRFDLTGKLVRIEDGRGNAHLLTHTGALLTRAQDLVGRELLFTYDAMDRLETLTDGTRTVSYGHLGDALASFTNAAGRTTTYNPVPLPPPAYALASAQLPAGNKPWTFSYSPLLEVSAAEDFMLRGWNYTPGPGSTTLTDPNGGTRVYEYDARNLTFRVTNPLGNQTSYTYDAAGRLESVTRPIVGTTSFGYHASSGYRSSVTLPDLRAITLGFTERTVGGLKFYDLSLISYPDGTVESFTYDASGNPLTFTDRAAKVWSMTWTGFGMPATVTNPAGGVTTIAYDVKSRVMVLLDAAGVSNEFTYDAMDRLIKVKHSDLSERNYAYDPLGNLTSATNEVGAVYLYEYDFNGLLKKITDPVATETQITYNGMDWRMAVSYTDATTVGYTYDALNRLRTLTDRTGRTHTYTYDAASRLTRIADPDGNQRVLTYDANGRGLSDADPLGNTHTFIWAIAADRITHWTDPLSNVEQYGYDAMDRLISANGPMNYNRTFGYDPRSLLDEMDEVTSHLGLPRGDLGQVTSVLDPNGKSWLGQFDVAGRTTRHTDPLGRFTTYVYDARGRLSQITSPMGTLTHTYDAASRILQRSYSDGTTLNYTYDAVGRLITANGASISYDAWGRVTGSNGITVGRDAAGRVLSVMYALGRTATYVYDTRGLLHQILDWLGGTYEYTYDAAGRRTRLTRPNGVMTDYQYDAAGRITRLTERTAVETLSTVALTRDARGQIRDALRRVLVRPPVAAPSRAFGYDDASQIVGWIYDGMGRLVDNDGPGPNYIQYNLASDMLSYYQDGMGASFTYDGLGQPITRIEGPITRDWVWNYALPRPSLSIVRQGGLDQFYLLYTPEGELVARYSVAGDRRYSHFDEMGNTIFLTDGAAAISTKYAYTPYGEATEALPDLDNLFTFAGQHGAIREGDTGLFRMGDRIYDSRTARFVAGTGDRPSANTLDLYSDLDANWTGWIGLSQDVFHNSLVIDEVSYARLAYSASDTPYRLPSIPGPLPFFVAGPTVITRGAPEEELREANPYQYNYQNPVMRLRVPDSYQNPVILVLGLSTSDRPTLLEWPDDRCFPYPLDRCARFVKPTSLPLPELSPSEIYVPYGIGDENWTFQSAFEDNLLYKANLIPEGHATVQFRPQRPGQVHIEVKCDHVSPRVVIKVKN